MKCDYEPDFQREVIYVNKVYNECAIVDCPTYRIPIPPSYPLAVNVVSCTITDVVAEAVIITAGEMDVVVNFVINVEYDSNGMTQFIQQTAQYRRRGVSLEGALPGMSAVVLPLIRCLNCRPVDGGTIIECDVGIYLVLKAIALVQLEVLARFAPEPPECEQVSPSAAQRV